MIFPHRVALIIPIADEAAASQAAATMSGNPADAQGFFTVRASTTGAEPATHLLCETGITEANRAQLPTLKAQFAGSDYLVTSSGWDTGDIITLGTAQQLAARAGVKIIEPAP